MTGKYAIGYLLFIVAALAACTPAEETDRSSIDLEKVLVAGNPIKLSELAKSIRYVPLETNDSLLLGWASAVEWGNDILVSARSGKSDKHALYLFTGEGKFIRKIGRIGRGPGEYISSDDFFISKEANEAVVSSQSSRSLLHFDKDGRYTAGIVFPREPISVIYHDGNYFYHETSQSFFQKDPANPNQLFVLDDQGKEINSYHPVNPVKKEYLSPFIESAQFSISKDLLYYHVPNEDTVYHVDRGGYSPAFIVRLGALAFPYDFRWDYTSLGKAGKMKKFATKKVYVMDPLVFIEGTYNGSRQIAVWNPATREGYADIVDDIDGLKMNVSTLENNRIIQVMEADLLLADTLRHSAELKKTLRHVTANSNPVLRIIALK